MLRIVCCLRQQLTARTSQFAKHLYIFAKRNCLANGKMRSENFENILHKHYNEHEYERAERTHCFCFKARLQSLLRMCQKCKQM